MDEVLLSGDQYSGAIKLGDRVIPCYVLENKQRVIAQREVVHLLTGHHKGGLERYTNARGVRDFMPAKLVGTSLERASISFLAGGRKVFGYQAIDIIDICDAYLKARDAGVLQDNQLGLAAASEILIRACAKVGIEALIDEATGYDAVRDANELQVKLQAYLQEGYREWTETFPKPFFRQFYKLEGKGPPVPQRAYPKRFGRYVMTYVYDTMDKDVANWLRENNPNPEGEKHHHQKFTDFGYNKLRSHLMKVYGIMLASTSMENFRENLNRAFPDARQQRRARLSKQKTGDKDENSQLVLFKPL